MSEKDVSIKYISIYDAADNDKAYSLQARIKEGVNVNLPDKNGNTALILSAYRGHDYCVDILLDNNADINYQNSLGSTALISAVERNCLTTVKKLVQAGAYLDLKNNDGLTAIEIAIEKHHGGSLLLMLEDSNKNQKDQVVAGIRKIFNNSAEFRDDNYKDVLGNWLLKHEENALKRIKYNTFGSNEEKRMQRQQSHRQYLRRKKI